MAADQRRNSDPRVVGVIAGVIVVLMALVAFGLLTAEDEEPLGVDGQLTATPIASATEAETTGSASPPATATPSSPAATVEPTTGPTAPPPAAPSPEGPREPTDADAGAFADMIAPGGPAEVVLADLDADGRNEVVVASILGGRSRIDIGAWAATQYQPRFQGEGGSADAIEEVQVRDINGTPSSVEIVVRQTSGAQGESVSVWGTRDGQVVPLTAVDGCWDGSHTYGIVGVTVEDQRITATCDGSPDPIVAWPSDIYVWDPELEAFAFERTVE